LHRQESDPEVMRYASTPSRDEAETRAALERSVQTAQATPRRVFDLAITLRQGATSMEASDELVGRVGFDVVRPEHREAMVWFTLRRDLWGQGIATEACAAIVDYCFRSLKLHRVYGDCDPRNLASARVMEKVGLRREAHLRENWWLHGEWCDSYIYALLEQDWAR
jgi:RimJ/RimL family protein N-acetyltransferase